MLKTPSAMMAIFFSILATDASAVILDYSYIGQVESVSGDLSDNFTVNQNIYGYLSINFGSEDGISDSFGDSGGSVTSLSFNTGCGLIGCANSIRVVEESSRIINSFTDSDAQISSFDLLSLDGGFSELSIQSLSESGKLYLDNDVFGFSTLGTPISGFPNILGTVTFSGDWTRSTPLPEVPVPAAVWLFGSGLIGLVGVARRKKV